MYTPDMISLERLETLLGRFPRARIAVVGDYFLDRYWTINPDLDETSIESGLTANQITARHHAPGAAGTVVNNLASLGVGAIFAVGFLGEDGEGFELLRQLDRLGVDRSCLFAVPDRWTPCYTKPMRGDRELSRFDMKNRQPTPAEVQKRIVRAVEHLAEQVDAIMVMDQVEEVECGVVTRLLRESLATIGKRAEKPLIYADSRCRIALFENVMIKCNDREALACFQHAGNGATAERPETDMLLECGRRLSQRTGQRVFITLGSQGQLVIEHGVRGTVFEHVNALPVEGPIDICGAGDATGAALVAALCSGATSVEAAVIGNMASSITIRQLATTGTASPSEILDVRRSLPSSPPSVTPTFFS